MRIIRTKQMIKDDEIFTLTLTGKQLIIVRNCLISI